MQEESGYRSEAAKRLQANKKEPKEGGYWGAAAQAAASMQSSKLADEFDVEDFGNQAEQEDEQYDTEAPTTKDKRRVR